MTTLISWQSGGGERRSCNATCHNAKKPKCVCVCGGCYHGAAQDGTLSQKVEQFQKQILEELQKASPAEGELVFTL